MSGGSVGRRHTQARGRARREALLDAAKTLLQTRDMDEITLPVLADHAGIPASSVYHFFPDMRELYKALARILSEEMENVTPFTGTSAQWQDVSREYLMASQKYFNANPAAMQLMLGPKTPPDIKQTSCLENYRLGEILYGMLNREYWIPDMDEPIKVFFRAVQIADAMFTLSVLETGSITDAMLEEAILAANAYLGVYLPIKLKRRKDKMDTATKSGRGIH